MNVQYMLIETPPSLLIALIGCYIVCVHFENPNPNETKAIKCYIPNGRVSGERTAMCAYQHTYCQLLFR